MDRKSCRKSHVCASAADSIRNPDQTSSAEASTSGKDHHANEIPVFPAKKSKGKKQRAHVQELQKLASDTDVPRPDPPPLTPEEERAIKKRLWYLAAKPPMYSVCIVPVLVGAASAYCEAGFFLWKRTGLLLLGSILIIAWLNLSNDAFDAAMGIDGAKAESVVNLTGNRQAVLWSANAALIAGASLLWHVVKQVNDVRVLWMLTAAISLGYMYQGPPFRLSFKGLGEPITFVTFGPLATSSFYLAQVAQGGPSKPLVSHGAAAASLVIGLTTAAILFCSHFHQMAGDKAARKMSPIVRLGSTSRGLQVLKWTVALTYAAAIAACLLRWLPWTCAITLPLSIPLAGQMLEFCSKHHKVPALIRPLKLYTVKWHSAVGLCLMLGFLAYPQIRGWSPLPQGLKDLRTCYLLRCSQPLSLGRTLRAHKKQSRNFLSRAKDAATESVPDDPPSPVPTPDLTTIPADSSDKRTDKRVSNFVKNTATTFAPRPSGATRNPAYKGSLLYTIFGAQAWLSLLVGGLLSFNLIFPTDQPGIPRLLGMWSIWIFTIPALRARECSSKEKEALNILFLAVPLLNVGLPFVWKSFPFIFSADVLALGAIYAWKLGPSAQSES